MSGPWDQCAGICRFAGSVVVASAPISQVSTECHSQSCVIIIIIIINIIVITV